MTIGEFKAYVHAFSDFNDGKPPTKNQWAKILERLESVSSEEKIVERILERRPWWPSPWYVTYSANSAATPQLVGPGETTVTWSNATGSAVNTAYSSAYAIGRVEAQATA